MTKNKKERYAMIDVMRLFFAICVVGIHTSIYESIPSYYLSECVRGICRLAVPFFFVVSGFFVGRKVCSSENEEIGLICKKYIKRLIYPLVTVELISSGLEIMRLLLIGKGKRYIIQDIIKHVLYYPYGAMWYVQACIVGMLLLYPFIKKKKMKEALVLGGLLYSWALLCNNYYFLVEGTAIGELVNNYRNTFISARNGVFVGFLYLGIGVYLGNKWDTFSEKKKQIKWLLVLMFAIYIGELYCLQGRSSIDDRSLYISYILLIPAMTSLFLTMRMTIKESSSEMCRHISAWLYYTHRIILACITLILMISHQKMSSMMQMILVLGILMITFYLRNCYIRRKIDT